LIPDDGPTRSRVLRRARGIAIEAPEQLGPALREALASGRPTLIQVPVQVVPTPTPGHWDINAIFKKPEV